MIPRAISWRTFAKENHFLASQKVSCCFRCVHAEHGYEGEVDCGHPILKAGSFSSYTNPLSVCDLFKEAKG